MVSLRPATSPPSHRSSSRTNTPEPDVSVSRRSVRTYQGASNRRKSSRLSQTSDLKEPRETGDDVESTQRASFESGSAEDDDESKMDSASTGGKQDQDSLWIEPDVQEDLGASEPAGLAAERAMDVDGESEEAEVASAGSGEGSTKADALPVAQVDEVTTTTTTTTAKRRRTSKPIIDLSTEEDEEEGEPRAKEEIARVSPVEKPLSPPKRKPGRPKTAKPIPKAQFKKVSAKHPSASTTLSNSTVDVQELSNSSEEPALTSIVVHQPPATASNAIEAESSSRTRRKRSGSPVANKPMKRQKAKLKKKSQQEAATELQCFQVLVFGDANASVRVRIPARTQSGLRPAIPDLVSLHPHHVVRSAAHDPNKPKSTFASYRFPLPDRRHHEAFDKVEIEIYGKKVKGPKSHGEFSTREVEEGQVNWTLEADEERCRWTKV